jgi:transcriptional regulator GlxA family with amidase domain
MEAPMPDREPTQIPQHFIFALVEDFSHMAFSCAVDPLRIANLISEKELYTVRRQGFWHQRRLEEIDTPENIFGSPKSEHLQKFLSNIR